MLKLRTKSLLLSLSMMYLGTSCRGGRDSFDPNFHVGDSVNSQIVNEVGHKVKCNKPLFDEYGCMHKEKIKELVVVLDGCLTKKQRRKVDREVDIYFEGNSEAPE